jgi:hypothetical protein
LEVKYRQGEDLVCAQATEVTRFAENMCDFFEVHKFYETEPEDKLIKKLELEAGLVGAVQVESR